MKSHNKTQILVPMAMLSAVSYLLAFIEIQVPLSPDFAKMDVSDLPALIAAFAFGPLSGVLVEFVKNSLQLLSTNTAGVGELANFLMGGSLAAVAGALYQQNKTKKTALLGCIAGSVSMAAAAGILNYYILLPLYENFMPLEQVIASFAAFIPFIKTKLDVVLWNSVPFNLVKGLLLSLVTMLIYKPLTPILKGRYEHERGKISCGICKMRSAPPFLQRWTIRAIPPPASLI